MKTGVRAWKSELSTVDTALLLGGMLFAQAYFSGHHPDEIEIRDAVNAIYRRIDWTWAQVRGAFISMGWTPEKGHIPYDWDGYNEAMLVYCWRWARRPIRSPRTRGGLVRELRRHLGPLHGPGAPQLRAAVRPPVLARLDRLPRHPGRLHARARHRLLREQPPRRSRSAPTRSPIRRATTTTAPTSGASPPATAPARWASSTGRTGRYFRNYSARGAGRHSTIDDGTIAPTAALGSLPFAPEIVIPAIEEMHARYGKYIYSKYGFLDSFNPNLIAADAKLSDGRIVPGFGWVASDYLGIDQGPILAMIENYRSELVWDVMRSCTPLRRGLERAGFTGGWLDKRPDPFPRRRMRLNPSERTTRRQALQRLAASIAVPAVAAGCGRSDDPQGPLRFWAMGREARGRRRAAARVRAPPPRHPRATCSSCRGRRRTRSC